MKELVIVSGKGGTGKTTITASLASLATNHVVADCDVDAPNLHMLLAPKIQDTNDFAASKVAYINSELCTKCGACEVACRFGAITKDFHVDTIMCEGCGVCTLVCPEDAIQMKQRISGYVYTSDTKYCPMVHALLLAGESNSGKLVTVVRKLASKIAESTEKSLVLVDGPPGIACPTIAAITGVTAGLIVTEPTVPAIHDLERILQLFSHFQIPAMVIINKFDLNIKKAQEIESYCKEHDIELVGCIPYDVIMSRAIIAKKPLIVHAPQHEISQIFRKIWVTIQKQLNKYDPI